MSHHTRYTPTSNLLLKDFQALFEKTITMLSPHTPVALSLPWLLCLPYELQEQIFSFVLDGPGGNVLFYCEALNVIQKIRDWPERKQRSVSCKGALFARWEVLNHTLYLAGLYDQRVTGSTQIKANSATWDHIVVRWNDVGVINVAFADSRSAPHIAVGPGYVQLLRWPKLAHEEIWITLEGLFISRIEVSQQCSRRILWSNSAQLPLETLPEDPCVARDMIAYYEPLEGMTGISVAHCNREIVAIHIHRGEEDTSLVFESVRSDATWVHCPFGSSETLEMIWYVVYMSNGSGLVV
ncbi:hypothetical protein T440DRAFT_484406 [Plenodomus tracheiphilus IPT5]|uniref:Uncharacterized protein n=1 Tax=Plenodomus tracheiphilus IPT5 TaxID=1408161 RepID=A0A6A7AP94_9PLEO|nr:hypothetical protein T440DRAFT_484406 [Plenodomus tracheiphilus IPT5]